MRQQAFKTTFLIQPVQYKSPLNFVTTKKLNCSKPLPPGGETSVSTESSFTQQIWL